MIESIATKQAEQAMQVHTFDTAGLPATGRDTVSLTALPHPLSLARRVVHQAHPGQSIAEILREAGCEAFLQPGANVLLELDGDPLPREMWEHICPRPGQVLTARALPSGGDKDTLRTVLQIVVYIIAAIVSLIPGYGPALGILIATAGTLLVNALVPPTQPKLPGAPSNVYSITGSRNRFLPGGRLPVVIGGPIRVYPDHILKPYTSSSGSSSYLHVLVAVHGPCTIEDVRIGDTPLSGFQNCQYVAFTDSRQTSSQQAVNRLLPKEVDEEQTSLLLSKHGPWINRSFEQCNECSFDYFFPNGLYKPRTNGDRDPLSVIVQCQYKRRSDPDTAWVDAGINTIDTWYTFISHYDPQTETTSHEQITHTEPITVKRTTKDPFWLNFGIVFPKPSDMTDEEYEAQGEDWDIRWRRLSTHLEDKGGTQVGTMYISSIRAIRHRPPVDWSALPSMAGVALKIKATGQLNGMIDQLNFTATGCGYVPDAYGYYDWSSESPAMYPPDAYLWVLRGSAAKKPLAAERLDLQAFREWREYCVAKNLKLAAVIDHDTSVGELLRDIASVGRASPGMRDNLHSVCVDRGGKQVVQIITPRNSRGLSVRKYLADLPHCVRVKYRKKEANYTWYTEPVYLEDAQGIPYDVNTAGKFEDLELWGVVDREQAVKAARFHIADAMLRPETVRVTMGAEHLKCTRGDLVRLAHDVLKVGTAWGRIKSVSLDEQGQAITVGVDEACAMAAGTSYALAMRLASGELTTVEVITEAGEQTTLHFKLPLAAASSPQGGELFQFGESDKVWDEFIVTKIEPGEELTARLTLRHYAPALFDLDEKPIPDFDPRITQPTPVSHPAPPAPRIMSVRSDESAMLLIRQVFKPRILVAYELPGTISVDGRSIPAPMTEAVQAQCRPSGYADQAWRDAGSASISERVFAFDEIEEGEVYDLRLRAVSPSGLASDWTVVNGHTVVGRSMPPPDLPGLLREGNILVWSYPNPPLDFAGFKVRYHYGVCEHWDSAIPAHEGLLTSTQFDLTRLGSGTKTVIIHACDVLGNLSLSPAMAQVDLGDPIVRNVVLKEDYRAAGFPGEISGAIIDDGILESKDTVLLWKSSEGVPLWESVIDPLWSSIYSPLEYVADYHPLEDALDAEILLDAEWEGIGGILHYRRDSEQAMWGGDEAARLWKADDGVIFWAPMPEWVTWPGRLTTLSRVKHQFRLSVPGGPVQPRVTSFRAIADVPDVVEYFEDLSVPTAGLQLPLTKTYRAIKNVSLTLQDDNGSASAVKILDKSIHGPLIKCFDAAGTATSGLIDAQVQGY